MGTCVSRGPCSALAGLWNGGVEQRGTQGQRRARGGHEAPYVLLIASRVLRFSDPQLRQDRAVWLQASRDEGQPGAGQWDADGDGGQTLLGGRVRGTWWLPGVERR